jgi:hypothetical protein
LAHQTHAGGLPEPVHRAADPPGLVVQLTTRRGSSLGSDAIDVQDGSGGDTANGGVGTDTCTTDPGDTATSC